MTSMGVPARERSNSMRHCRCVRISQMFKLWPITTLLTTLASECTQQACHTRKDRGNTHRQSVTQTPSSSVDQDVRVDVFDWERTQASSPRAPTEGATPPLSALGLVCTYSMFGCVHVMRV
eukprot:4065429-Amphidinium_carterae.1